MDSRGQSKKLNTGVTRGVRASVGFRTTCPQLSGVRFIPDQLDEFADHTPNARS